MNGFVGILAIEHEGLYSAQRIHVMLHYLPSKLPRNGSLGNRVTPNHENSTKLEVDRTLPNLVSNSPQNPLIESRNRPRLQPAQMHYTR